MILTSFLLLGLGPSSSISAILYATHYSGTVSVLSLSGNSLTVVSSTKTCGTQPSWLTLDSASRTLYCLDEFNYGAGGTLSTYSASSSGTLTQTAKINIPGNGVHSTLYGGSDGKSFQAIAHYQSSTLSTVALPITANSKTLQSFKYIMAGSGPDPSRQEAPHPHQALLDPTGAFILVPDLGADFLRIYSVNKNTGFLTSCANVTVAAGSGPRHAEFWAPASGLEGLKLFLGNELSNTASAFAVTYPQRDGNCLNLTLTQTGTPYPSSRTVKQGQKVGEVRVKGNTITISNRADNAFGTNNDSLAVFSISSAGSFAFQDLTPTYGSYPRTLQINKAGDLVAIGNQNSATVVIVKRDPSTGKLGEQVASALVGTTGFNGNGGLSSVIWDE